MSAGCNQQKASENNAIAQKREQGIANIDAQIAVTRHRIDSVRTSWPLAINDSLATNKTYIMVHRNAKSIDSIKNENKKIINRAYALADKHAMFNIPRRNENLFTEFDFIPEMQNLGRKYFKNKQTIAGFNQSENVIRNFESDVRRHFDSIAVNHIYQLQLEMDSLLNRKHYLIQMRDMKQK